MNNKITMYLSPSLYFWQVIKLINVLIFTGSPCKKHLIWFCTLYSSLKKLTSTATSQ